MNRTFVSLGSFLAAVGVMLGAFGAHSLPQIVPAETLEKSLETWKTGAHYHLIHAVALVLVGAMSSSLREKQARMAGRLFVIGIAIFGGTLYALALGAPRWFGAITPLGGLSFIGGWVVLGVAAMGNTQKD